MAPSTTNPNRPQCLPLLAIVGATGVGKNDLAQRVAEETNATLISVDSRKIYRGLDIGTAKPAPEVRRRFDYAMIDCVNPDEPFSAGRYARQARQIIAARRSTERPIILVGGTGFYLEALMQGLADLPDIDPALRAAIIAEAAQIGWEHLHEGLSRIDPAFAAAIHPADKTRILRGWEIYRQTGTPLSLLLAESPRQKLAEPIVAVWVDVPRPTLHARIEQRVQRMVQQGLFDEVAALLSRGFGPDSPGLATVGYQEVVVHLRDHIPAAETVRLIVRNTRLYAKRQLTWFRHRPYVTAVPIEDAVVQRVMELWSQRKTPRPSMS